MRKPILSLLLGAALTASISSCEEKEPELSLPPITQDGRNTLGFKANGKVWVNYGDICDFFACEDNFVEGRLHKNAEGTYSLIVQAYYNYKSSNGKQYTSQIFSFSGYDVSKPGTYTLSESQSGVGSLIVDWSKNEFYHLKKGTKLSLTVTRLDTVNNIVSGQFEGNMVFYTDSTKTLNITEGRFDTKLTYSW